MCLPLCYKSCHSSFRLVLFIFSPQYYNTWPVTFFFLFYQNWLAFAYLDKPPFSEHNSIYFANDKLPHDGHNNAFCKVSTSGLDKLISVGQRNRVRIKKSIKMLL